MTQENPETNDGASSLHGGFVSPYESLQKPHETEMARLSASERTALARKALAEAEALEQQEAEEKRELAKKRFSELRQDSSSEAVHQRLQWMEHREEFLTKRLALYDRFLDVLAAKLFGADHNLHASLGDHHDQWMADMADQAAANRRDQAIVMKRLTGV